jgi:hypothetical protein
MSGQFQVDVDALKNFSHQIQALVKLISADTNIHGCIQSLAPKPYVPLDGPSTYQAGALDFGKESVPGFTAGADYTDYYYARYDGFTSNFQAFLDSLTVLAEAAATIAGNYENATNYDQVGQTQVQNAIANAPSPEQTQTPQTQTS